MNSSEFVLPSNKKFGLFFTLVFVVLATHFFIISQLILSYIFLSLGITLLFFTLFKAEILHPLNKSWMKFGMLLGKIVGPIVLGVIFFILFTTIAFLMRAFGRDELSLKFVKRNTYWINRGTSMPTDHFKHQF